MAAVPSTINPWALKRASLVCPMPVAMACGRVLRARTPEEKIDASLRAAETLTRYLASVALSSFAARESGDALSLAPLQGNLAFGHFLTLVQQVAALNLPHPAEPYLAAGFRPKRGKEPKPAPTDAALIALLTLRNDLQHDLNTLSEAKALTLVRKKDPERLLNEALAGVDALLCRPLFIVEEQRVIKRTIRARRLLLMGESADPAPDEIELNAALDEDRVPYLAIDERILKLPPALVWDLVEERANYQLHFIDAVKARTGDYKTVDGTRKPATAEAVIELADLCNGKLRVAETVTLGSGVDLAREWSDRRRLIEDAGQRGEGLVPWERMDEPTLRWFASRLTGKPDVPARDAVAERLLDGRTSINAQERRQLILLFGKASAVREELRRDVIDLRSVGDPSERWEERLLIETDNLIGALRQAVDFFARHLGAGGVTIEGLTSKTGSADYIAIREALVNQFIHQDYGDASAPAQVEIRPEMTVLFNPGFSLVEADHLVDGGKSQSRNPLIARALRLIGFAELAGSGLRALQSAWRRAQRRPPRFFSDRQANNFSVVLDWRPMPEIYDEEWLKRHGVKLTPAQVTVLRLAQDPSGISTAEAASATGLSLEEAEAIVGHLVRQQLVDQREQRVFMKDHLKDGKDGA
jgi:hypothetical protein